MSPKLYSNLVLSSKEAPVGYPGTITRRAFAAAIVVLAVYSVDPESPAVAEIKRAKASTEVACGRRPSSYAADTVAKAGSVGTHSASLGRTIATGIPPGKRSVSARTRASTPLSSL
jgi:hypothetical protein